MDFDTKQLATIGMISVSLLVLFLATRQRRHREIEDYNRTNAEEDRVTLLNGTVVQKLHETQEMVRTMFAEIQQLKREVIEAKNQRSIASPSARNKLARPSTYNSGVNRFSVITSRPLRPRSAETTDDEYLSLPNSSQSETSIASILDEVEIQASAIVSTAIKSSRKSFSSIQSIYWAGPYIDLNPISYNPRPSSNLSEEVRCFCQRIDRIFFEENDEKIIMNNDIINEFLNDHPDSVDLLWRYCRNCLYTRGVCYLKKKPFKTIVTKALVKAKHGISLVKSITKTQENKITKIAPMYKWGAGIIGISAEIVSGVGEKVSCGQESLDNYIKSLEYDSRDYYTYFSIARYHWEIYKLPTAVKWAANRIAAKPFNSSMVDVLEWLENAENSFPYESPYLQVPADILILKAQAYFELKDMEKAREAVLRAEKSIDIKHCERSAVQADVLNDIKKLLTQVQ